MSLFRFQEIKRYLKISNSYTDGDSMSADWSHKLEPLLSDFLNASKRHLKPGRDVSIDKILELFKGRSKHTMKIDAKRARKGFKAYCLTSESYLLSLKFSSKTTKISGLLKPRGQGLPDTQAVVVQLARELPKPWQYVIYTDNFFTSTKLAIVLKDLGFAIVGTCKAGSGMPAQQLKIKKVSTKQQNWGFITVSTDETKQVLCVTWQDLNTVQYLTTAYTAEQATTKKPENMRNVARRKDIPACSRVKRVQNQEDLTLFDENISEEEVLLWPELTVDYNRHMGGGRSKRATPGQLPRICALFSILVVSFHAYIRCGGTQFVSVVQMDASRGKNDSLSMATRTRHTSHEKPCRTASKSTQI